MKMRIIEMMKMKMGVTRLRNKSSSLLDSTRKRKRKLEGRSVREWKKEEREKENGRKERERM